jgi:hypothetical protein
MREANNLNPIFRPNLWHEVPKVLHIEKET